MKKIIVALLLICGFICAIPTQKVFADETKTIRITSIIANVYDNTEIFEEENILTTLNYNDLIDSTNVIINNELKFYVVSFNNKIGYISYYDAIEDSIKPISKKIKANCTVISNSNEQFVNVYDNYENNFIETNKKIKVNSKVIVNDNFSYNKEYNLVYYYDEQDNFNQGYIKTNNLRKDGINLGLIIGIILILISFTAFIIIIIYIIKKRRNNGNKMLKKHSS